MTFPALFVGVLGGTFGLIIGSFLTAFVPRMAHDELSTIWQGRSQCDGCQKTLRWWQLVPVLGWLVQGGKCADCRKPIAWLYPATEMVTAVSFGTLALRVDVWGVAPIILFLLVTCLIALALYDALYHLVDRRISLPAIGLAVVYIALTHGFEVGTLWAVCVALVFFGGQWLVSRGRWLGAGDIDLGILLALIVGWPAVFWAIWLAYCLGTATVLPRIMLGKLGRGTPIPLGSFLMLSALGFLLYPALHDLPQWLGIAW